MQVKACAICNSLKMLVLRENKGAEYWNCEQNWPEMSNCLGNNFYYLSVFICIGWLIKIADWLLISDKVFDLW